MTTGLAKDHSRVELDEFRLWPIPNATPPADLSPPSLVEWESAMFTASWNYRTLIEQLFDRPLAIVAYLEGDTKNLLSTFRLWQRRCLQCRGDFSRLPVWMGRWSQRIDPAQYELVAIQLRKKYPIELPTGKKGRWGLWHIVLLHMPDLPAYYDLLETRLEEGRAHGVTGFEVKHVTKLLNEVQVQRLLVQGIPVVAPDRSEAIAFMAALNRRVSAALATEPELLAHVSSRRMLIGRKIDSGISITWNTKVCLQVIHDLPGDARAHERFFQVYPSLASLASLAQVKPQLQPVA